MEQKSMVEHFETIIIGAGFSGIGAAREIFKVTKLKSFSLAVLEKASDIGGVWHANQYPNAGCDVFSHLYSFSWFLNPNWTKQYSRHDEIKEYLKSAADHIGLRPHIKFNHAVSSLEWNEKTKQWHVRVVKGDETSEMTCTFIIPAIGQLNVPSFPTIPGLDSFKGKVVHTAEWPASFTEEIAGKSVGFIGNGASAIQAIPGVAPLVKQLFMFQRTPSYVIHRWNFEFSKPAQVAFKYVPGVQRAFRACLYTYREISFYLIDKAATNAPVEMMCHYARVTHVTDKTKRALLKPKYAMGCKRVLISNKFYPAVDRPNVQIITDRITNVTPEGICVSSNTNNNEKPHLVQCDHIVLATGFKTLDFLGHLDSVTGKDGKPLDQIWPNGAEMYLGICHPELPNLFTMYGPNTNLGHNSIVIMIECQARYIAKLIARSLKQSDNNSQSSYIAVDPTEFTRWNEWVQKDLKNTTFASDSCKSWYKAENGRIVNNWSNTATKYYFQTSSPKWKSFKLVA